LRTYRREGPRKPEGIGNNGTFQFLVHVDIVNTSDGSINAIKKDRSSIRLK